MKIKTLTLLSNDLESQKTFYRDILGFTLSNESSESFTLSIGWSKLTFKKSKEKYYYHYCFLIPSNKFEEAYEWFSERMDIVSQEEETKFDFISWNAKSFYFYDGNGNIAECIVRYDLDNLADSSFNLSQLLCVNEIGAPSNNILKMNEILESQTGSVFWKGNFSRFGTNGDNEGLFLLVNNEVKKIWFPTQVPTQVSPFKAEIETGKGVFNISFSREGLTPLKKS